MWTLTLDIFKLSDGSGRKKQWQNSVIHSWWLKDGKLKEGRHSSAGNGGHQQEASGNRREHAFISDAQKTGIEKCISPESKCVPQIAWRGHTICKSKQAEEWWGSTGSPEKGTTSRERTEGQMRRKRSRRRNRVGCNMQRAGLSPRVNVLFPEQGWCCWLTPR